MDEELTRSPPWEVLFLLLPDSLILDWAGPAEALRIANKACVALSLARRFVEMRCCPSTKRQILPR